MRLINADKLPVKKLYAADETGTEIVVYAVDVNDIKAAPTIDAVPVVRCGKCKHWKPTGREMGNVFEDMEPIGGCRYVNFCRKESDFCSYGEPKEGYKDG